MPVVLKSLYESVLDREIRLLAGEKGLSNIVRWVHMVESLDTSDFLEGEEFVFTTGIGMNKAGDLEALVQKNVRNSASGMLVNIGPYITDIPPQIITYCNEHDFPLFTVPWHIHLAQIMRSFCSSILQSEQVQMELSYAARNAIFFFQREDLYVPAFEHNGFQGEWSYCVAVMELDGWNGQDEKMKDILRHIENALVAANHKAIALVQNETVILVFARMTEAEVKQAVRELLNGAVKKFGKEEFYLGIGQQTRSIRCIYKSYRQAKKVTGLHRHLGQKERIEAYREMGVYKLLLAIDNPEIEREYWSETLGELVRYDETNGTDFVKTLELYLHCGGSVRETADALFVHRNTINYRIRKIEEILDCDLADLNVRMDLLLGYKLKAML